MSGISNAIVTLNVSDDSIYVWDEQSSDSTGSVSLTLVPSYELSPAKVAAIKKLVANSVPRLLPENVAVINAVTMEELQGQSLDSGSYYGLDRLDFESKVEKRLEDIKGRGVVLRDGQTLYDLYLERTPLYEKYADIRISETGLDIEQTVEQIVDGITNLH